MRTQRTGSSVLLAAALLAAVPALAGPGSLGGAIALIARSHGPHQVSMRADGGHADIVLCHDEAAPAEAPGPVWEGGACERDHRLHVAVSGSFVARGESRGPLATPPGIALPLGAPAIEQDLPRTRGSAPVPATIAPRLQRTVVLRL